MLEEHKVARRFLRDCTLTEYNNTVTEIKLIPVDRKILDEYILKGKPEFQIAMDMNMSPNAVQKRLCSCYRRIYKLII